MTRPYLVRYLKLRLYRIAGHLAAIATVLFIVVFIVLAFSHLPFGTRPVVSNPTSAIPQVTGIPPILSARNIIILDPANQVVIYQKAAADPIYPASTTKLMTALTVLDNFSLDDSFTVTKSYPDGQDLGFKPGERVSVTELLYALLIQSANDAAEILAENFCAPIEAEGEVGPCGRQAFVDAMNTKAITLNLRDSHFKNPTGLDEEGHLSTAADLARIAELALKHPLLSRIVASENAIVSSPDFADAHILTNTNQLLGKVPGVLGMKTGFTDKAGQALITYVSRDNHPLIFVVLGSQNHFTESALLIEWAYSSITWP